MWKSSRADGQERRRSRVSVDAIETLVRERNDVEADRDAGRVVVRCRLAPPARGRVGVLSRAERLTPYAAETIAEDALRIGRGAQLEVTVAAETGDAGLAYAERALGRLRERGIRVHVVREGAACATTGATS